MRPCAQVVPLELLLDVMARDAPAVSSRIQSILVPSYYPDPQQGAVRQGLLISQGGWQF